MSVQTKQRTLAMMTGFEPIARFFATRSSFPCKVCQLRVSQLKGSVQKFLSAKRMLLSLFYLPQTIRIRLVGERGFEPPTPWSRTRCSTRLSHSPTVHGTTDATGTTWRLEPRQYSILRSDDFCSPRLNWCRVPVCNTNGDFRKAEFLALHFAVRCCSVLWVP